MLPIRPLTFTSTLLALVCVAVSSSLNAQEQTSAGIVRVSDEQEAEAGPTPVAVDAPPASRQRPVRWANSYQGAYTPYGSHAIYGGYAGECVECGGPACNGCESCYDHHFCETYGLSLSALCCHCRLHRLPKIRKGCHRSPDFGWSPPSEMPQVRMPIGYQRYWPLHWSGEEPDDDAAPPYFPTVYMPTDTTQLGYYYNVVPTWQPNRAMLPPAPRSEDWHCRGCPTFHSVKPQCNFGVHQTMTPGSCPRCRPAAHATW